MEKRPKRHSDGLPLRVINRNINYMKAIALLNNYCSLGYEVTLIRLYGKDAVRMKKVYSYKLEKPIYCEQIQDHDTLTFYRLVKLLDFMYNDIQQQEETGNLYEPSL